MPCYDTRRDADEEWNSHNAIGGLLLCDLLQVIKAKKPVPPELAKKLNEWHHEHSYMESKWRKATQ